MPATTLMSVDLPAPFGPTTQASSPDSSLSETSHSAVAAPYRAAMDSSSSMRPAGVGRHDVGPFHDIGGNSFRDDPPVVEHDDAIGERHDRAHDVLDEDDGRSLVADRADQRDGFVDLPRPLARQNLLHRPHRR